jgi:peptidoglycan/xylan/chitin deacetylase (PgdA/CDA1 family)
MRGLRRGAEACLKAPWARPLSTALSRWYRGRSTSLLYHRISPELAEGATTRTSAFHPNLCLEVAADRFTEQMRELHDNHHCIPLPQAVDELRDGGDHPPSVTVTFDDGYRDNLRVALPILEKYEIPATIYLTTGLIDRTALLWWEELELVLQDADNLVFWWAGREWYFPLRTTAAKWAAFSQLANLFKPAPIDVQAELMQSIRTPTSPSYGYDEHILSWDEVRALDRHPLITLAAHTVNHPQLRDLHEAAAAREMRQSRERLEQELGHPVPYFAYPFGGAAEAGRREFRLCEAEGFEFAVTTRSGHWHDGHREHLFALPRIMVEYFDTLDDFRFKLSGLEAFLRQKGRHLVTA